VALRTPIAAPEHHHIVPSKYNSHHDHYWRLRSDQEPGRTSITSKKGKHQEYIGQAIDHDQEEAGQLSRRRRVLDQNI
jgi:hypothetical protein